MSYVNFEVTLRPFTRREKTSIRQDAKRFHKIGRDHGCVTLDDYAEFVSQRLRHDAEGFLTQKSTDYLRGLGVYFGEQLMNESSLVRVAAELTGKLASPTAKEIIEGQPGWFMIDVLQDQCVLIPVAINEHVLGGPQWRNSLDDFLDQIVDWNLGYVSRDDLVTNALVGSDVEPDAYLAA